MIKLRMSIHIAILIRNNIDTVAKKVIFYRTNTLQKAFLFNSKPQS